MGQRASDCKSRARLSQTSKSVRNTFELKVGRSKHPRPRRLLRGERQIRGAGKRKADAGAKHAATVRRNLKVCDRTRREWKDSGLRGRSRCRRGAFAVSDELKSDARETVTALRERGIESI